MKLKNDISFIYISSVGSQMYCEKKVDLELQYPDHITIYMEKRTKIQ